MSLAILIGASAWLVNEGLSSWVFTRAEQPSIVRQGPPPSPYFAPAAKDVSVSGVTTYECTDGCDLPDGADAQIAAWQTQYTDWQSSVDNNSRQRRNIVNALSFLLVALPVFILHFRIVRRDHNSEEKRTIRSTYFYGLSLISLLMAVASIGFLVNLGLNEWISPGEENPNGRYYPVPAEVAVMEKSAITSILNCKDKCDIDPAAVELANQWEDDYQAYQEKSIDNGVSTKHQTAAGMLAILLIASPVFWYHFTSIRGKKSPTPTLQA